MPTRLLVESACLFLGQSASRLEGSTASDAGNWSLVPGRTEGGPVTGGETMLRAACLAAGRSTAVTAVTAVREARRHCRRVPNSASLPRAPDSRADWRAVILAPVSWRLLLVPAWRSLPKLTAHKLRPDGRCPSKHALRPNSLLGTTCAFPASDLNTHPASSSDWWVAETATMQGFPQPVSRLGKASLSRRLSHSAGRVQYEDGEGGVRCEARWPGLTDWPR
ncbi:hypothetical protein VTN96DRAFT_1625 [Rasamsonia emersonii]